MATVNAKLIERGLMLKPGSVMDATLIAALNLTKNDKGERDHEIQQIKRDNLWHFGIKAHIGDDADSGLVHTITNTAANAHNITQAHALLHGEKEMILADLGYRGGSSKAKMQASICGKVDRSSVIHT